MAENGGFLKEASQVLTPMRGFEPFKAELEIESSDADDGETKTDPDKLHDEVKRLRAQIENKSQWRRFTRAYGAGFVLTGAIFEALGVGWLPTILFVIGAFLLVVFAVILLLGQTKDLEERARDLEIELDVLKSDRGETRALKMFKHHQTELRRYYNLARQHSRIMLAAGLLCIGLGAAIIVGAILVITGSLDTQTEALTDFRLQIVVGVLGAVGGILTNYVAAIYMKMFAVTSQSLNDFHNRLVSTHHLHLANYVVSRIDSGDTREEALKDMVIEMARQ